MSSTSTLDEEHSLDWDVDSKATTTIIQPQSIKKK
jgi:hypothetical protein